jgi:imidazolonepropionase-like amidohydrolase
MNLRPAVLLAILLTLLLAAPPLPAKQKPPTKWLVITNVTVVDVTDGSSQPGVTVVIRNDRITGIARHALIEIAHNVEVVNANGKYLIPGLWDMHVHLTLRPEPKLASETLLPLLVAHGVVGVRDMGGDWEQIQQLRKEIAGGKLAGFTLLSPGPFVDGPQPPGASVVPVSNAAEARAAVRALKARGVDFIKVQAKLSRESYFAAVDEAKHQGIALVGHVPESMNAGEVSDAGQRSLEHLSPALPGDAGILFACSAQEAELRQELAALGEAEQKPDANLEELRARTRELQTRLLDSYNPAKADALMARLARNRTWVVPTLIFSQSFRPLSPQDLGQDVPLRYVPAATRQRWEERRKRYVESAPPETFALTRRMAEKSLALAGALHRAGVPLMAGTDSFDAFDISGFSLHQELELLVKAGLKPVEALQAATLNPAKFLGRERDFGAVEVGKVADLVLLDADPMEDIRNTRKIRGVVLHGHFFDRVELDKMLAGVEAAAKVKAVPAPSGVK